ncbi:MAG: WD40 repeat domain-containing protein [Thermoguttaceae bacterium]
MPDGKRAVVAGGDYEIDFYDLATGDRTSFPVGLSTLSVAITPDGQTLVVGGLGPVPKRDYFCPRVQIWDVKAHALRKEVDVDSNGVRRILLAPDGRYAYVEGNDYKGDILRIDIRTGAMDTVFTPDRVKPPLKRRGNTFDVVPVALSPDGNDLVIGTWQGVVVWNLKTESCRFSCALGRQEACSCAVVAPDGSQMATPGVEVWDFRTGRRLKELVFRLKGKPPEDKIIGTPLAFSPDSKLLVACRAGGYDPPTPAHFAVCRTDSYSEPVIFRYDYGGTWAMRFVPGTHKLVTGGDNGLQLWDLDELIWPAKGKKGMAGKGADGAGEKPGQP